MERCGDAVGGHYTNSPFHDHFHTNVGTIVLVSQYFLVLFPRYTPLPWGATTTGLNRSFPPKQSMPTMTTSWLSEGIQKPLYLPAGKLYCCDSIYLHGFQETSCVGRRYVNAGLSYFIYFLCKRMVWGGTVDDDLFRSFLSYPQYGMPTLIILVLSWFNINTMSWSSIMLSLKCVQVDWNGSLPLTPSWIVAFTSPSENRPTVAQSKLIKRILVI